MARKQDRKGAKKGTRRGRTARRTRATRKPQMPFGKRNYILLAIGMLLIVTGYTIMRIENEVDGFVSLYVAPIILIAGYLEIIYAVWWRPEEKAPAGGADQ